VRARLAIALAVLALAWVALEYVPVRRAPGLDHLVLISIDTLRADHLGAYGGPPGLTPSLDAVAEAGVVVESAVATAPTTLASHTSLLTGRWPHTHGVPRNGFVVDPANLTLAEHLSAHGFHTAAFVGATPLSASTGLDQGFDVYDAMDDPDHAERSGGEVTDAVLEHLDAAPLGPTFLFVHYYDVHAPYGAPDGRVDDPEAVAEAAADTRRRTGSFAHIREVRARLEDGDPGAQVQSRALATLYRAGVRYADAQVGRLLDGLHHRGLLERSLVVLTSDHGETMDDPQEWWDHGYSVAEATVHVPLLLRFPGRAHAGYRLDRVVSHVDLVPTLCGLLGLPAPPTDGVSFMPALLGEAQPERGPVFAEATKPWRAVGEGEWANASRLKAARAGERKVVWDPREQTVGATVLPSGAAAEAWPELERALREWSAGADPLPSVEVDDAGERAQLEALGYTGD
jgi:choline-sulfatase